MKQPPPISQESVIWGYRLFLDREPENNQVVYEKAITLKNSQELRREFMQSEEFLQKNSLARSASLSGYEPRMFIDDVHSEYDLQALFEHIQDTWPYLGETEPHWSVLAEERFLHTSIHNSRDLFYNPGKDDTIRIFNTLDRNNIDYTAFRSCLEYGCGLGRVTRWLADRF